MNSKDQPTKNGTNQAEAKKKAKNRGFLEKRDGNTHHFKESLSLAFERAYRNKKGSKQTGREPKS